MYKLAAVFLFSAAAVFGGPENWDIPALDTARNAAYLSGVEKDIILELNKVRSDPKKYAELYIKPRIALFDGKSPFGPNSYKLPSGTYMTTAEGAKAVRECYNALRAAPSSPILMPSYGMSRAAKDHVNDQGPRGATGHSSSSGASPWDRLNRYGAWGRNVGENISYGSVTGQDIVIQLLIDDGVPSRGHRENNMSGAFGFAGVGAGAHKKFGSMAVLDFAGEYTEKTEK
ncbi:MAG: CAP domain-containing protein [Spirochaetaceae bacterium]|jgi:uncharacterized protein YkwD|nr:CAP domain-containing protein [Spirochaetaceae bacterium]